MQSGGERSSELRSDRKKVRRKREVGKGRMMRLMREWRVCGGGNQRDSEMNERTLKAEKGKRPKSS